MTLEEAIARLPDSPGAIAAELVRGGHKGWRVSSCNCPLARRLAADVGELVSVGPTTAHLARELDRYPLPLAATEFVVEFDSGSYSELMEEGS